MFGHVFGDLAAYAERQIDERGRARVERHLARCADCRRALETIRSGIAHASTLTVETMPDEVAVRIRQAVSAVPSTSDATRGPGGVLGVGWRVAAAAILAVATIGLYWHVNRPWIQLRAAPAELTRFEEEGRQLHDRLTSGELPLTFHSADEQAVWQWLAGEDAPVTSMVISRPEAERPNFVPVGATVLPLAGARTSVLSYRIDGRPVTLALAFSHDVPDAPPPGWWSKRVTHRRDADGTNTLTWTVGGGTYVMVSELDGAGQRACLICHTAPRFTDALTRLSNPQLVDRQ